MEALPSSTFLEPERIIRYFDLEHGDHVADFGAGHGYFTIPMAKAVGGDGKVYALDIQKSVLDIVRNRAKLEHLLNIELVWANLEEPKGSKLQNNFLEFVLIANILFQAENKLLFFQEAHRVLRERKGLAVIEWDQFQDSLGPPVNLRVKKEDTKRWAAEAGFVFDREFEAGSHHYGLLFKKT